MLVRRLTVWLQRNHRPPLHSGRQGLVSRSTRVDCLSRFIYFLLVTRAGVEADKNSGVAGWGASVCATRGG